MNISRQRVLELLYELEGFVSHSSVPAVVVDKLRGTISKVENITTSEPADPLERITAIMGLDKCDCVSLDGKHQCPEKPEHMVRVPDYMQNRSRVLHLCTRCYSNAEILFQQHKPR